VPDSDTISTVSVLIPTRARPAKLATCLAHLSAQNLPHGMAFETLVAIDGPDPATLAACDAARAALTRAGTSNIMLRVVEGPREGYMVARNRALAAARGELILSINDDVRPAPGFVAAHARAHTDAAARGIRLCIVSGASPWIAHEPDRLFDRMIRETGMVFFYNVMDRALAAAANDANPAVALERERWRDWGFRHAWGLNTSIPAWALTRTGAYAEYAGGYGYEDVEIVHRVRARHASTLGIAPVLYRPEALAPHDHRMEPREYLAREYRLGYTALSFARVSAACARELFGRDIAADPSAALRDALEFLDREQASANRAAGFLSRAATLPAFDWPGESPRHDGAPPAAAVAGHASAPTAAPTSALAAFAAELAREAHVPAKRWMWHAGFADALIGAPQGPDIALARLHAPA
jgi:glycosyltransferase involved in cell wall biosynthesis